MFSLIITIVSIALVALLAAATLYFGGDIHSDARKQAAASQAMLAMQQVQGATTLYKAEHTVLPTSPEDLITAGYLKFLPETNLNGAPWSFGNGYIVTMLNDPATCKEINVKLELEVTSEMDLTGPEGVPNGIPECALLDLRHGCCESID